MGKDKVHILPHQGTVQPQAVSVAARAPKRNLCEVTFPSGKRKSILSFLPLCVSLSLSCHWDKISTSHNVKGGEVYLAHIFSPRLLGLDADTAQVEAPREEESWSHHGGQDTEARIELCLSRSSLKGSAPASPTS